LWFDKVAIYGGGGLVVEIRLRFQEDTSQCEIWYEEMSGGSGTLNNFFVTIGAYFVLHFFVFSFLLLLCVMLIFFLSF
jgi:hypothetical protein